MKLSSHELVASSKHITISDNRGPRREVPKLATTIESWLSYSEPFLSKSEKLRGRLFAATARILLNSAQKKLVAMAQEQSWTGICLQNFYLNNRLSMPFYSNVCYLLEDDQTCQSGIDRASTLIVSALNFYQKVRKGQLTPEISRGYQLDLDQFRFLFSTARLPGLNKDTIQLWENQTHIVVSACDNLYRIDFDNSDFQPNPITIRNTLKAIISQQINSQQNQSISILTALPRPHWARVYSYLLDNNNYQQLLETVNSAILFIALDLNYYPANRTDKANLVSYLNYRNRWFDKSHQIIVAANGTAGINRDHTMIDGHASGRYVSELYEVATELARSLNETATNNEEVLSFQRLNWSVEKTIENEIKDAQEYIQCELNNRELITFSVKDIGSEYCQAKAVSADAICQIAIQLASYYNFGQFLSVSESVNMNHFEQGRYDTIMTLTTEARAFIINAEKSTLGAKKLSELLTAAIIAHKNLLKNCKEGHSPIFHLTALIGLQKENKWIKVGWDGLSFFNRWKLVNQSFSQLMNCDITTSNQSRRSGFELGASTDTSHGILGIIYMIYEDRIEFSIKVDREKNGQARELQKTLDKSFSLIKNLLKLTPNSATKPRHT